MDTLTHIENGAHLGANGHNRLAPPTDGQKAAGNYRMGRIEFHGLKIAIECPRGTYRTGIDAKTGQRWTCRMAAHYGYINGTRGKDNDAVDCFVGYYPQSEMVYVINQYVGGRYDEAKAMLAFPDEDSARRAYLDSYERGWNGLGSLIPMTVAQFKWWLANGDMSRPASAKNLPIEGHETMNGRIYWNDDATPDGMTLDALLYQIRIGDKDEKLIFDAVTMAEIMADADGVLAFDALVTPFARLERKMELMQGVMERASQTVKPLSRQISEPFKQRGTANVAVIFELSDGQTISIFFHNPDTTPNKLAPADEVISWKWMLNKKDITIVAAPERGEDVNVREVAKRVMKLAEKNSATFQKANVNRSDRMQRIQGLRDEIVVLEGELKGAQNELEAAKIEAEDRAKVVPEPVPTPAPTVEEEAVPTPEEVSLDPSNPADYIKIMHDPVLQAEYQDQLDSMMQMRHVAVRNALRELGWSIPANTTTGQKTVNGSVHGFKTNFLHVGAGRNVVAVMWDIDGGTTKIADDLKKTPSELAAAIDAAVGEGEVGAGETVTPAERTAQIGDRVKFSIPGVNRPTPVSGSVTKVNADGTIEVKTQQHGYHVVKVSEVENLTEKERAAREAIEVVNITPIIDVADSVLKSSGWVRRSNTEWDRGAWKIALSDRSANGIQSYFSVDEYDGGEVSFSDYVYFGGPSESRDGGAVVAEIEKIISAREAKIAAEKATELSEEDREQAKYSAFDMSKLKMPSATQLGFMDASTQRKILFVGEAGWTNSQILDLERKPKVVADAFDKYLSHANSVGEEKVSGVVSKAVAGATDRVTPVALYDMSYTQSSVKSGLIVKTLNTVALVNDAKSFSVLIDVKYLGYFEKSYKACDYYCGGAETPVVVKKGGKVVGIIQSMSDKSPDTLRRALKAASAPAATATAPLPYTFASASDEFRAWVAATVDKPDYSPFATAMAMDEAAKKHGAVIEWGFFGDSGATLDSIALWDGEETDDEDEYIEAEGQGSLFDSAVFDGVLDGSSYVGKIKKDGVIVGRVDMGDDGKAMVYVGESGDQRVKDTDGRALYYSDDDAVDMIKLLFTVPQGAVVPQSDILVDRIVRDFVGQNVDRMYPMRDRVESNPSIVEDAFGNWWGAHGKEYAQDAPLMALMKASNNAKGKATAAMMAAFAAKLAEGDRAAATSLEAEKARIAAQEAARLQADEAARKALEDERAAEQAALAANSKLKAEYALGINLLMKTYGLSAEDAFTEAQRLHNSPEEISQAYGKKPEPTPTPEPSGLSDEDYKAVAATIMEQLGGNKFKAMTGAKDFMALSAKGGDAPLGGLRFSIPGKGFAKDNINRVFIRLNGSDLYDVEFGVARGTKYKAVTTAHDVGAESLQSTFTQHTGLDTNMGKIIAGGGEKAPEPGEAETAELTPMPPTNGSEVGDNETMTSDDVESRLLSGISEAPSPIQSQDDWDRLFPNRSSTTPIGAVVIGMNQYAKMIQRKRARFTGMVKPTLESPCFVFNDGDNGKVFVKSFKEGSGTKTFVSVAVGKDGLDVVVSNGPRELDKTAEKISEASNSGRLLYSATSAAGVQTRPSATGSEEQPSHAGGLGETIAPTSTGVNDAPPPTEADAITAGLQQLAGGAVTDTDEFDRRLDELANRAEAAGLMEQLDAELNAAADKLTELLNEAEKNG